MGISCKLSADEKMAILQFKGGREGDREGECNTEDTQSGGDLSAVD